MKRLFTVLSTLVFFTGCQEITTPTPVVPVVTSVEITPKAAQLEVGDSLIMTAVVRDQNGNVMSGQTISWTSNTVAVATVSSTGIVVAKIKGQTTIGADVGGKFTTATVFVIDPTVATVTIQATVPSPFYVGQTVQATALVKDAKGRELTTYNVVWQSSNPSVATVSDRGLITAVSAGTTIVSAVSAGKSATLVITTTLVPVATVSVATTTPFLVGRSIQLTPVLRSASGATLTTTQRTLVWASTDTTVATVNQNGLVHVIDVGTVTITCVVENKVGILSTTASRVVINYITVTPDSTDIPVGGTRQFVAKAFTVDSVQLTTAELNGRTVAWTIGDTTIAVLSPTTLGLVIGVADGTTTVTATIGTVHKSSTVVVVTP